VQIKRPARLPEDRLFSSRKWMITERIEKGKTLIMDDEQDAMRKSIVSSIIKKD